MALDTFRRSTTTGGWQSGSLKPPKYRSFRVTKKPESKERHSLIGNLLRDVRDTVVGLPMGAVMMVKEPTKSLKTIGESFKYTWEPLIQGDPAEWWDRFHEHPLAPILDVASVVTLGAGSAARGVGAVGRVGRANVAASRLGRTVGTHEASDIAAMEAKLPGLRKQAKTANIQTHSLIGQLERTPKGSALTKVEQRIKKLRSKGPLYGKGSGPVRSELASLERQAKYLRKNPLTGDLELRVAQLRKAGPLFGKGSRPVRQEIAALEKRIEAIKKDPQLAPLQAQLAQAVPRYGKGSKANAKKIKEIENRIIKIKEKRAKLGMTAAAERAAAAEIESLEKILAKATPKEYVESRYGRRTRKMVEFNQPQHRVIETIPGAPAAYKFYHRNPAVRARQKLVEKAMTRVGYTDAKRQQRWLEKNVSGREAARDAMFEREMLAAKELSKDGKLTPEEIGMIIGAQIERGAEAHAFVVKRAVGERQRLAEGWQYLRAPEARREWSPRSKSPEDMADWIQKYGQRLVTKKKSQAMRTPEGDYLVLHRKALDPFLSEAENARSALMAMYTKTTTVWKWLVLATAPRYFVNNVVGNSWMVAMSRNPLATSRGLYNTIREMRGERAARRAVDSVEAAQRRIYGGWQDKWYTALHQGFGFDITRFTPDQAGKLPFHMRHAKAGPVARLASQGLYGVTHFASDTIPRRLLLNEVIRGHPKYKPAFRKWRQQGLSRHKAHQAAADEISGDPVVRGWVEKEVSDTLGQYYHYSASEKAIKGIIPFYGWDRAITKHTFKVATDRPYLAAVMSRMGQMGSEETKEILGKIPRFMQGVIPLSVFGVKGKRGRVPVLGTQGLNPYATFADVAEAATSLVTKDPRQGEVLGGQINPLITAGIEQLTGASSLTGRKVPQRRGGLLGNVVANVALGTPLVRLGQTAIQGPREPKRDDKGRIKSPLLYEGDLEQQLYGLLGAPVRQVSKKKAAELYRREQGIRTPPKSTRKTPLGSSFSWREKKPRKGRSRVRVRTARMPSLSSLRISSRPKQILKPVSFGG